MRIKRLVRRKSFMPAAVILFILLAAGIALSIIHFYGISSVFGISTKKIIMAIPQPVRSVGEDTIKFIIDLPYAGYYFKKDKIPNYFLVIDKEDIKKLNSHLPEPTGDLSADEKIKASAVLWIDGKKYNVKVNYRGETSPHWLYPKKSWRIEIKGGKTVDSGVNVVDLIIPEQKDYAMEALNNYRAGKLGLEAPFSDFVNLNVNGENHGTYFLVAHWSAKTIEKMGLDSDTDLYGENFINEPIFTDTKYWKKYLSNSKYPADDYSDLDNLINLASKAGQAEFEKKIFDVIDKDNFFAWWTHQILSGSEHEDWAHNIRIYFDKNLNKLTFIPWDVGGRALRGKGLFINYNPVISRILKNESWRGEILSALWDYVKDKNNLKDDIKYYDDLIKEIRISVYKDRFKEPTNRSAEQQMVFYRAVIEYNFNYIKSTIADSKVSVDIYQNYASGVPLMLDLSPSTIAPIDFSKIKINTSRGLSAYWDSNGNGRFDSGDKYLGYFDNGGELALSQELISNVTAQKEDARFYAPFDIVAKHYCLFLVGDRVIKEAPNIEYTMKNAITGGKVDVESLYNNK